MSMAPTIEQARSFQALYDHFNAELFGGELAPCLLNFSRKSRALGFFAPERWEDDEGNIVHEISINPQYLAERSARQTASTLVHEMCHFWQQEHGKPSRRGYHNKEWADKMEEVGLTPSHTGRPGGRRTGQRMTHYIAEGGPFEGAWEARPLTSKELFPYQCRELSESRQKAKKRSRKSKTKYSCPGGCGLNVWAKPDVEVACMTCEQALQEVG